MKLYLVLLVFFIKLYWILLGFTGFNWFLVSFTQLYRILMALSECEVSLIFSPLSLAATKIERICLFCKEREREREGSAIFADSRNVPKANGRRKTSDEEDENRKGNEKETHTQTHTKEVVADWPRLGIRFKASRRQVKTG